MMSSSTLVKVESSYKIKVLVVGSLNSGKHSFCSKHSDNFSRKFRDIIGVDIYVREEVNSDGEVATLSCWNCAPQERFKYYHKKFYRGALGALLLFDVTSRESFNEARYWVNDIRKNIDGIPIILIGNKVDLNSKRVISYEEAKDFAKKEKLIAFIETSTKEDLNISESFNLINEIIQNFIKSKEKVFNIGMLDPSVKSKLKSLRVNY